MSERCLGYYKTIEVRMGGDAEKLTIADLADFRDKQGKALSERYHIRE